MRGQALTHDRIQAALRSGSRKLPRHKRGEEFLCGPIPLAWLRKAAALPGKVLAVGVALWFKAGATKRAEVQMTGKLLAKFGINRKAGYRGLKALECAGLVTVKRHAGRCAVVTILEPLD